MALLTPAASQMSVSNKEREIPGVLTIVNHNYRNKNVMSFIDIKFCFIFMQDTKDNYSDVLIKQEKREDNHRNKEAEVDK